MIVEPKSPASARLRAEGQHYRIRIGDYRLGTTMDGETVVLRRFLPRGEIYRYFP
jgi:mRNA interferase RelE/StbE